MALTERQKEEEKEIVNLNKIMREWTRTQVSAQIKILTRWEEGDSVLHLANLKDTPNIDHYYY
jgi:hypothetical protein